MNIPWEDGFAISVRIENGAATIAANKAGLLSLSRQLAALAQEKPGSHIHYDEHNALEGGSQELIIARQAG